MLLFTASDTISMGSGFKTVRFRTVLPAPL